MKKGMTTQSSILIWRIPWTEEPGRLQSTGSQSSTGLSNLTLSLFDSKNLHLFLYIIQVHFGSVKQSRKFIFHLSLYSYAWAVGKHGILLVFRHRDIHSPSYEWVSVESFSWISPSVNVGGWDAVVSPGCRCVCFVVALGWSTGFSRGMRGQKIYS